MFCLHRRDACSWFDDAAQPSRQRRSVLRRRVSFHQPQWLSQSPRVAHVGRCCSRVALGSRTIMIVKSSALKAPQRLARDEMAATDADGANFPQF